MSCIIKLSKYPEILCGDKSCRGIGKEIFHRSGSYVFQELAFIVSSFFLRVFSVAKFNFAAIYEESKFLKYISLFLRDSVFSVLPSEANTRSCNCNVNIDVFDVISSIETVTYQNVMNLRE